MYKTKAIAVEAIKVEAPYDLGRAAQMFQEAAEKLREAQYTFRLSEQEVKKFLMANGYEEFLTIDKRRLEEAARRL